MNRKRLQIERLRQSRENQAKQLKLTDQRSAMCDLGQASKRLVEAALPARLSGLGGAGRCRMSWFGFMTLFRQTVSKSQRLLHQSPRGIKRKQQRCSKWIILQLQPTTNGPPLDPDGIDNQMRYNTVFFLDGDESGVMHRL